MTSGPGLLENSSSQRSESDLTLPEDSDTSILQKPLNAGIKNVKQILKCIQSGSREIKDIILNECDIIYECKICRSLFRSLANFLFHKRCFCKEHLCESMVLFEHFEEQQTIRTQSQSAQKQQKENDVENKSSSIDQESVNSSVDNEPSSSCAVSELSSNPAAPESSNNCADVELPSSCIENEPSNQVVDHELSNQGAEHEPSNQDVDHESSNQDVDHEPSDSRTELPKLISADSDVELGTDASTSSQKQEESEMPMDSETVTEEQLKGETSPDLSPPSSVSKTEISLRNLIPPPVKIISRSNIKMASMRERLIEVCKSVHIKLQKSDEPTIILKPIKGNTQVVFQQIEQKNDAGPTDRKENTTSNANESSQRSSSESDKTMLESLLQEKSMSQSGTPNKNEVVKKEDIHLTRRKRLLNRSDCHVQTLKCLKCDTQFTTLRTLYFHMMSLHSQKRLYYPCPFCKTLFVQMYGVTRHLIAVHGKKKEHIDNKMREAIRKSAIWKRVDDSNVKAEEDTSKKENKGDESPIKSEPVKSFEQICQIKPSEDKTFHSYVKVEKHLDLHQCSKCERVFGRKSSQVSHQKFCIMNSKSDNSDLSSPPSSPTRLSYLPVKPPIPVLSKKPNFEETKINVRPKRGAEKQMHKDFVNSQTLKWRSANKIETSKQVAQVKDESKKAFKTYEKKVKAIVNAEKLLCLKCDRKFSSFSNLRRHAAIHIGWTRFQCKNCEYQSYNKSDCRHHVERIHGICEADLDRYVIHLVSDVSQSKVMSNAVTKTVKQKKRSFVTHKRKIPNRKKRIQKKGQVSSTSSGKSRINVKKVLPEAQSPESKRPKRPRIVTITRQSPIKKTPSNYKSVSTSSPTTIILSKTSPTSPVQTPKNASQIAQSSDSSSEKSTRASPRKIEVSMKIMTETAAKSTNNPKNALYFAPRIPMNLPSAKTEVLKLENGLQTTEKTSIKKNRVISDWFVKKDRPSTGTLYPPLRRDSAPVIIGLVAASQSGLSVQKKTKFS